MFIHTVPACRSLFENWPSVLAGYWAGRVRGGGRVRVVCRGGGEAWLTVGELNAVLYAVRRGFVDGFSCSDRGVVAKGSVIPLDVFLGSDLRAPWYGWRYDAGRGAWVLGDAVFKRVTATVIEVFNHGFWARVKRAPGRVVVDIGAGPGDTPVYFIHMGASRVIALEPDPLAYAEMLENLRLNRVEDRVVALQKPAGAGTLRELVEEYRLRDAVLKADCEGCEHSLFQEAGWELGAFTEIALEYHGSPRRIAGKLREAGFKVLVDPPWGELNGEPVGFLHALS